MHITSLRKVGGSVMLAVPPAILDLLHLQSGATVGLAVEGDRLVVQPQPRRRYMLDALLAQCEGGGDSGADPAPEERDWLDVLPAGDELL